MTMIPTMIDPIVKKRKFAVEKIPKAADIGQIEENLRGIKGISVADIDPKRAVVQLEYDLRQVKFEDIEKVIEKLGLKFSQKLFQRWKRGMAKFTEQNELESLNAPVSSCCKDPREKSGRPQ